MPGIGSVGRWLAVFGAATAGSWLGRIIAARLYQEPLEPLLALDARALLNQDVAPGFLAAETLGRALRAGIAGEVAVAVAGSALSAVATGAYVEGKGEQ
jgi:hypothetical protein